MLTLVSRKDKKIAFNETHIHKEGWCKQEYLSQPLSQTDINKYMIYDDSGPIELSTCVWLNMDCVLYLD